MAKENMKQTIADELVSMLNDHSLEEITVKDLTGRLGVTRQTFYYHFHDIYEIVEWIFQSNSDMILSEFSTIDSWQFGYVLMMKWVQNNKSLVLNCYHSVRKDYVETFMNRILYQYIYQVVQEQSKGMRVTEQQKTFIARFFTLAINAISQEWIASGMTENPNRIAEQVNTLIKGDFNKALRNFEQENRKAGLDTSYGV